MGAEAEVRGPERFFYDKSTYPASYNIALESARANPVPRGDTAFAGYAVDMDTRKDRSYSGSPVKGPPTQARVCVMCDHCWRAEKTDRCEILRCPECLSDQPGDEYLTAAELAAMAQRCREANRALAKSRKALMAAASNARSALRKKGSLAGEEDSD